jgi:hypothetical protein
MKKTIGRVNMMIDMRLDRRAREIQRNPLLYPIKPLYDTA